VPRGDAGRQRLNLPTAEPNSLRVLDRSRQAFAEVRFGHAWTPSRFDLTRAARLREVLRRRPQGRVLDVGCYDGQFITRVIDNGCVVGVDVSHVTLRAAQSRDLKCVRGQLESGLPFA